VRGHETTFAWYLGANGYFQFIGCNFFSSFHSICNLSSIKCKRFYIKFSSIFCNIFFQFFIVKCCIFWMKHYKVDEVWWIFTEFSLNNLVKGLPSPASSVKLQLLCLLVTTRLRKLLKDYILYFICP
jgi:hypothetical protein